MSSPGFSLDANGLSVQRALLTSRIIALFLQSAIWGIFSAFWYLGAQVLLNRGQPRSYSTRNRVLLLANTLMLALATTHLGLTIYTSIAGFVTEGSTSASAYNVFYNSTHLHTVTDLAQYLIYVTQTVVGDALMLYRLYALWNGSRSVMVAPVVLFIIDAIGGYTVFIQFAIMSLVFYGLSFLLNIVCSISIYIRVLRSYNQVQAQWQRGAREGPSRHSEAIAQSAIIYSLASAALLVTDLLSPNVGYVLITSLLSPLIGVVFSVMVLHIARQSAQEGRSSGSISSSHVLSDSMHSGAREDMGREKVYQSLLAGEAY